MTVSVICVLIFLISRYEIISRDLEIAAAHLKIIISRSYFEISK